MTGIILTALLCLLILCLILGDDFHSGIGSFIVIATGCGMIWFLISFLTE